MRKISRALLYLFLIGFAASRRSSGGHFVLPTLDHLTAHGCSVERVTSDQERWRSYVWAEHDGERDWRMLYAERRGKHASKKCLDDCDHWVSRMRKLLVTEGPEMRKSK
jgi:hypothetical protein